MTFNRFFGFSAFFCLILSQFVSPTRAHGAIAPVREWNLLVFINGKNDLDQFGGMNINQMEMTGSTDQMNILVQWASLANKTTKRLYVKRDQSQQVTSPVLQDLGPNVDMGDYRSLVDFAQWSQQNFPAKHYFIVVWNHGSGWHQSLDGNRINRDISNDDLTGHSIRTEELAYAMGQIARIIGHKVDIYGSDACLMGMVEVAAQMANFVDVFVGSEEVEPGEGWPYATFVAKWATNPYAPAEEVAKLLTQEFVRAYSPGGIFPKADVTLSALRTSALPQLQWAMRQLAASSQKLTPENFKMIGQAVGASQRFEFRDYVDIGDLLRNLNRLQIPAYKNAGILEQVGKGLASTIISNQVTPGFAKATGLSVWFPTNQGTFYKHGKRYMGLEFTKATGWGYLIDWTIKASRIR